MKKINIIHQDQDLLVINKPPGLVVNRAETIKVDTLQDWLEKNIEAIGQRNFPEGWRSQLPKDFTDEFGTPEAIFESRTGLAHRLDKDTSGCMLIAKHPGSLVNLLKQFRERTVQKKYTCLTHGKFALPKGEVNLPIDRKQSNRKQFTVAPDGRSALTLYEVEKFYPDFNLEKLAEEQGGVISVKLQSGDANGAKNQKTSINSKRFSLYEGFSVVSCWPKTGRTHQIRVHMAHLKHPIVGDSHYLGKKRTKLDALWCKRQFLHASEIEFTHPRTGDIVKFQAELSDDLKTALSYL